MKQNGTAANKNRSNAPGSFTSKYNLMFILFMIAISLSLVFYLVPIRQNSTLHHNTRIYLADNITPAHQKIIDLFNRRYRGSMEIVPVNLPFTKFNTNERKELIARTLRNGNSRIDVFAVDQIWVPRFAKWAEPLSRYFSRREIAQVFSPALSTCYHENILVGIPLHIDIGLMYYRKDLLAGLPDAAGLEERIRDSMTWEEFIDLGSRFDRGRPFYVFQGENYEGLVLNLLEVLAGSDNGLVEDGQLSLNRPEVVNSCQLLVDLIHKYGLSPGAVTSFNESATYAYALSHDVPFFRGWPGFLKEIAGYPGGSEKAELLGIAALPHFRGNQAASAYGGWNLMVSKHSSKKDEAALFLKFILSEEAQKILYETAGYLPVLNSLYTEQDYIDQHPELVFFRKLLERGIHRPVAPDYTKMSGILSAYLHKALKKEITVREALSRAESDMDNRHISQTIHTVPEYPREAGNPALHMVP